MITAHAMPTHQLMPAAGSRGFPVATASPVDVPERLSGRTPSARHCREHPIHHHVTGPAHTPESVVLDKAGRRYARRFIKHRNHSCTTGAAMT